MAIYNTDEDPNVTMWNRQNEKEMNNSNKTTRDKETDLFLLQREIFRMQTQLTRKDIEVDELKEENKSLRESNERMKEALQGWLDLKVHTLSNGIETIDANNKTERAAIVKAKEALQANNLK